MFYHLEDVISHKCRFLKFCITHGINVNNVPIEEFFNDYLSLNSRSSYSNALVLDLEVIDTVFFFNSDCVVGGLLLLSLLFHSGSLLYFSKHTNDICAYHKKLLLLLFLGFYLYFFQVSVISLLFLCDSLLECLGFLFSGFEHLYH